MRFVFHLRVRVNPLHVLHISNTLSRAGADGLQTGTGGALRKPQCSLCLGCYWILHSGCCKDNISHHAQEALCRAKLKFHGRQNIIFSRKWGFTKYNCAGYLKYKSENRIIPDRVNAKVSNSHHTQEALHRAKFQVSKSSKDHHQ